MSITKSQNVEETFSVRLRKARIARGLTQEQLAEKIGASKGAVGNWESPSINRPDSLPSAENLIAAAAVLGVTVDFLLHGSKGPPALKETAADYEIDDLMGAIQDAHENLMHAKHLAERMRKRASSSASEAHRSEAERMLMDATKEHDHRK